LLNKLDAHIKDGSESANKISDDLSSLSTALSSFIVHVYNKVQADRDSADPSEDPKEKELPSKNPPVDSTAQKGDPETVAEQEGAPKQEHPPVQVTRENAEEVVQEIAENVGGTSEVSTEQVTTLEQIGEIVSDVVQEKQDDIAEAQSLSKDLARKLMDSLQMISGEDSSVTLDFLGRALAAARDTINSEVADASLKRDLLQATNGMLQKVSQGATSEADKQELMSLLTSFNGELQSVVSEHTDELTEMKHHLAVIRQKLLIHPLTGGDVKELSESLSQALDATPNKADTPAKSVEPPKEYTPPTGDPREKGVHALNTYLVGLPANSRSKVTTALHDVLMRFRNDIDQVVLDRAKLSDSLNEVLGLSGRGAPSIIEGKAKELLGGLLKLIEEEIPDFSTDERQTIAKAKQALTVSPTVKVASAGLLHKAVALHFSKRAARGI
jgi:predicted house-cleaning noncanonical NTP pyrophosphatase (MazG superfamily)